MFLCELVLISNQFSSAWHLGTANDTRIVITDNDESECTCCFS